ncbi:MAG TPA: phage holin family protein [Limnobacter sp.]|uniref:phage holin family protein n=1 Tax=Limnobacter sp. TaxID=2003368 RepID=UPI002ED7CC77
MLNPNSRSALKRVAASLLGMGQTRLELMGVELAQARQAVVSTVLWGVVVVMAVAFASLFLGMAVVVLAWDSHRLAAILGCMVAYLLMALWAFSRLKAALAAQPPLFEATIAEFGRDRQAILDSMAEAPQGSQAPMTSSSGGSV